MRNLNQNHIFKKLFFGIDIFKMQRYCPTFQTLNLIFLLFIRKDLIFSYYSFAPKNSRFFAIFEVQLGPVESDVLPIHILLTFAVLTFCDETIRCSKIESSVIHHQMWNNLSTTCNYVDNSYNKYTLIKRSLKHVASNGLVQNCLSLTVFTILCVKVWKS